MFSRLTVILHPNETRVDIVLNDRRFNNEEYHFSRKKAPVGNEERMLKRLNNVIGIRKAETSKSSLHLETEECSLVSEYIPKVIEIVREFGGSDYDPEVYVDNRRHKNVGKYDDDGWTIKAPTPFGFIDIGVPAKEWK